MILLIADDFAATVAMKVQNNDITILNGIHNDTLDQL